MKDIKIANVHSISYLILLTFLKTRSKETLLYNA